MVGMDRHERELQNEYGVDRVWMRNGLVKWEKRVNVRKWGRRMGKEVGKEWLVRSKSGLGGWAELLSDDMPQKELNETGLGTPRKSLSLLKCSKTRKSFYLNNLCSKWDDLGLKMTA
jgi:hypothetical protein